MTSIKTIPTKALLAFLLLSFVSAVSAETCPDEDMLQGYFGIEIAIAGMADKTCSDVETDSIDTLITSVAEFKSVTAAPDATFVPDFCPPSTDARRERSRELVHWGLLLAEGGGKCWFCNRDSCDSNSSGVLDDDAGCVDRRRRRRALSKSKNDAATGKEETGFLRGLLAMTEGSDIFAQEVGDDTEADLEYQFEKFKGIVEDRVKEGLMEVLPALVDCLKDLNESEIMVEVSQTDEAGAADICTQDA